MLTYAQLIRVNGSISAEAYNNAFLAWESTSASIASKIRAYFPNTQLQQAWNNYSLIVSDVVYLSSYSPSPCPRIEHVQDIQKYLHASSVGVNQTELDLCRDSILHIWNIQKALFPVDTKRIDWSVLIDEKDDSQWRSTWFALKQSMLNEMDSLIQDILNSPASTFH
jgi:hypothetical protein